MIPKIIHYCWFGNNPKTELVLKCIESWKKYLSDYEIIEWNETNTNLTDNRYVREAYENKKWAFVSDYVRLKVLYDYGGIYLDTDIEMIDSFDSFLGEKAFMGFEDTNVIQTGVIGSEKNNPFIGDLIKYYNMRPFVNDNGKLDQTPNVTFVSECVRDLGLKFDNTYQAFENISIFPKTYFCPKDGKTGLIHLSKNTICIHYFDGSWIDASKKNDLNRIRKYSSNVGSFLGFHVFLIYKLFYYIIHPKKMFRRIVYKEIG